MVDHRGDLIRPLGGLTAQDVAIAGGKGANLGELVRGGFDVPDGFVVTTAAYDRVVAEHGPAGLATADLPDDLADAVLRAYADLGGGAVAVRSSATTEDLPEASFAGQQETFLNVSGEAALLAAVRDCWASLWTERAVAYRSRHAPDATASLAVVVQRLVPADAAGVMFTANPANGRVEETVITASWGLGEAVVSGRVEPDTIVVDRSGGVQEYRVADKAVRTETTATGTRTAPTPEPQRTEPVLTEAEAVELARLGAAIEAHFGSPQDIEWVRADGAFRIVQARPVTALPPRVGPVPTEWPVPARGMYFRASITEQLPDPLSPLFADLMATAVPDGLARLLAELTDGGEFGDVGFPTINGYAFYRYSTGAITAMLKGSPALIRLVVGDGGRWVEERWRERLAGYADEVAAEAALDPAATPASGLLDGVARLVAAMAYYYTAVQTVIPVASSGELVWTATYDRLLKRPGDPPAETFLLGYDSEPLRAEKDLYDLARWAREAGLAEPLTDLAVDPLADHAPAAVPEHIWQEWRGRLRDHLAAHGHTAYNLDPVNPVPADDPRPLLQALRFHLAADAPDPHQRQARAAAARNNAEARLLTRLRGRRQARVRALLGWAQRTGPLREDALAAMGLYLPPARRLLAEFGARLVREGSLAEPADAWWLTLAEARAAAGALDAGEAASDLREVVAGRQAEARGRRLATPPQYLPKNRLMNSMEWMYPAREGGASGGVLTGNAGTGGRVTAPARVLSGPDDFAAFRPGEVLVASITTPAYTPLFAMAGAVVTDIGGVLSHGSIVAREYGIPAVLGTGAATKLISTGDEVTVDGAAAKVFLPGALEEPGAEPSTRRRWLVVAAAALAVVAAVRLWSRRRR